MLHIPTHPGSHLPYNVRSLHLLLPSPPPGSDLALAPANSAALAVPAPAGAVARLALEQVAGFAAEFQGGLDGGDWVGLGSGSGGHEGRGDGEEGEDGGEELHFGLLVGGLGEPGWVGCIGW